MLCDNGDRSRRKKGRRIRMQAGGEHRNEEDSFAEIRVRCVDLVVCGHLPGPLGTTVPHLHIVELGF